MLSSTCGRHAFLSLLMCYCRCMRPVCGGRWIPGAFLFTACVGLLFLFNRRVFAKANGAANNTVGLLSVVRPSNLCISSTVYCLCISLIAFK